MSEKIVNFLIYNLPDEKVSVDIMVNDETIWISQKGMAELFGIDRTGIGKHLKNIFREGELDEEVVCAVFAHTTEHGAIKGKTAAEIVESSADHTKENMGLTTWKNSPGGRILKSDVTIAKNYLNEKEIRKLERAVSGFFDYVEDLIEDENIFTMEEFAKSINEFLAFKKYRILSDKGSVSKAIADKKAKLEYDEFNKFQKIVSDFDKEVSKNIFKNDNE